MKRFYLFLVITLANCFYIGGQNPVLDSLRQALKTKTDDSNKVNILNLISEKFWQIDRFDTSLTFAIEAQVLSEKLGFKKGVAVSFRNLGIIYWYQGNYPKALDYQSNSLTISQQIGDKKDICLAFGNIGVVYSSSGNYAEALEYKTKALSIAQEMGDNNRIGAISCGIGVIYDNLNNHQKALEYYFKALGIAEKTGNKFDIAGDMEFIGRAYMEENSYPKALEYATKSLSLSQEIEFREGIAVNLATIGDIYDNEDNYPKALEYNFRALSIEKEIGNKREIAGITSDIGEFYLAQKNYKQAKIFLDSALILSKKTGDNKSIENTYQGLSKLDSALGNYKTSYAEYKQFDVYRDSVSSQENVKKITQIELSYKFKKMEDSVRAEQQKAAIIITDELIKKRIIYNSIIILLILIILLAFLLINRQQIKLKKDKLLFEKETQRMELELANGKILLDEYIKGMIEKNTMLEQAKVDLEELKGLKAIEIEEHRFEDLEHLNNTTILTEEDWNKFKALFEQVHKGFFIRLKEKLPNLTQAEIRFVCLLKLKLDTRQMSEILGVSPNTVRTLRYRLKKKLNLPENNSIEDITYSI